MSQRRTHREPVVVIACQVLKDGLAAALPEPFYRRIVFMEYGLHRAPARLHTALQAAVDTIARPAVIVLGYGLCGNGLGGLRGGRHTLILPRVDDCISLLLGSRRAYYREMATAPGTYFLTRGWLEAGSHPLSEYREYAARYGPEEAAWIMDQQYHNYERLALIAHNQRDLEASRPKALEVARYCRRWGMRYEEIMGEDRFFRRLAAVIQNPEDVDAAFLVVPPGSETRPENFQEESGAGFEAV